MIPRKLKFSSIFEIMHDLHTKLDQLQGNVKSLIRKLNEAVHANEILQTENNKLKLELRKKEAVVSEVKDIAKVSTESSDNTEEKYHKIKKDIMSCIKEIDDCIQLIEQ